MTCEQVPLPPVLQADGYESREWMILDEHGRAYPMANDEALARRQAQRGMRLFVRTAAYSDWSEVAELASSLSDDNAHTDGAS